MAYPKIASMAKDAARAGLVAAHVLMQRMDAWLEEAREALAQELDERELVKAEIFIQQAQAAAKAQWAEVEQGTGDGRNQM